MKKLIVIAFLLTSLTFGETTFTDIEDHWSQTWVEDLTQYSITSGYPDGRYKPDSEISVEEFITFTIKAIQTYDISYQVEDNQKDWSTGYIQKSLESLIIPETMFEDYKRPITREEMAYIIVSAYSKHYPLTQSHINTKIPALLYDYHIIDDRYIDYFLYAIRDGFISGKGQINNLTIVDPKGMATRGEAAVLLIKLLQADKREIFLKDHPHQLVKTPIFNGSQVKEIDIVYYAKELEDGKYITEIFELNDWLEANDEDMSHSDYNTIRERILGSYSHISDKFYYMYNCDYSFKEDYLKYGGDPLYWFGENSDFVLSYDSRNEFKSTSPYNLVFWTPGRQLEEYATHSDYFKGEYGMYLIYIFTYLFEDDYEEVLHILFEQIETSSMNGDYTFNKRKFTIGGNQMFIEAIGQ